MSSNYIAINQLNQAAYMVVIVETPFNFALGAIGLIFNVLIFTRPSLRNEPCSFYFFSSTCFSLFVVFVSMPVRLLASAYNIDTAYYNRGICKIETFAFDSARTISCWLITCACADRFFHSSLNANIRRLSSLKIAKWAIGIITVIITILYSHMIVYYDIINVSDRFGNVTPTCNGPVGIYRSIVAFWYLILYSLCPSFLMLLFGFLTLNNIRRHRRAVSNVPRTNQILRRTDNQLLRMLIAQVFMIIIATLPFSIYQLYTSFTSSFTKSTLQIAQENLAGRIAGVITYFAHTTSFYLYTLTGTIFRKEFIKIIQRCRHPARNIVHSSQNNTHVIPMAPSNRGITTVQSGNVQK
ncbi:unnamed protein product [Adineta steineri]|uniref:G-protein coupled receptors family 1 profile domain-containing protein n=1 Tax=Adineta steineri TaxID=433720 RepID=A0A815SUX4_9BILA|nr:unnamed protein product [Adineta steineri]CAF1494571.1 unnamed protein product [Adineta steineri]